VVEDHGPGVRDGERERLFRPYERMVSAASMPGLGLYITAEIVKAHGGTIRVDDSAGGGARFVVELPRATVRPD
jgi:signal transduction histidine kinase